jgi:hypothetical protein
MIGCEAGCADFPVCLGQQIQSVRCVTLHIKIIRLLRGVEMVLGVMAFLFSIAQIRMSAPHTGILSNRNASGKDSEAKQRNPNNVTNFHA